MHCSRRIVCTVGTAALLALVPGPNAHPAAVQPAAPDSDPLRRAAEGMRAAGERISAHDTSTQTREIQQRVVDDLSKLIDIARRQQNQPPPQRPQQAEQQEQQAEDAQEERQEQQPQESAQPDPGASAEDRPDPEDSEERTGDPRDAQVPTLMQRRLVDEVWGHLPARLRQKLQNIYSEKTLPQYEDLVRRYFEALAEENSGSGAH